MPEEKIPVKKTTTPPPTTDGIVRVSADNKKTQKKSKRLAMPKSWKHITPLLLAVVIAVTAIWYVLVRDNELSNEDVLSNVSALVTLPENESPTIANIEDPAELISSDPFYAGSQAGDKIIVYPQSRRAIIYRPATNEIVKDGGVEIN